MRHAVAIAVELQTDVFMHQRLDGISVVGHDDRQRTERGRYKTVDRRSRVSLCTRRLAICSSQTSAAECFRSRATLSLQAR
jgi:hypothetical protein